MVTVIINPNKEQTILFLFFVLIRMRADIQLRYVKTIFIIRKFESTSHVHLIKDFFPEHMTYQISKLDENKFF